VQHTTRPGAPSRDLRDDGQAGAEVVDVDRRSVDAVKQDPPGLRAHQAEERCGDGALPGPCAENRAPLQVGAMGQLGRPD
jgi:hypothetical protein